MGEAKKITRVLDLNGLLCPSPSLIARKRLAEMAKGEILEVICSDRSAQSAIQVLCRKRNYELAEIRAEKGLISFIIRK